MVTKRSNPHPQHDEFLDDLVEIQRLDLLVLKGQVLVEEAMRELLVARLNLDAKSANVMLGKIARLPFSTLANIALAGERLKETCSRAHKLNDARVEVAHHLQTVAYKAKLKLFIDSCRNDPIFQRSSARMGDTETEQRQDVLAALMTVVGPINTERAKFIILDQVTSGS